MRKTLQRLIILFALLALPVLALQAQDGGDVPIPPETVTDDQVNDIASQLYCPVCENIPLDTCGTTACDDWRYEIRLQLEQGYSEDAIITDFVNRFGDRVVGTPQDPVLRALSLVTPVVAVILGILGVVWMFRNWRTEDDTAVPAQQTVSTDDKYRALLESDIRG